MLSLVHALTRLRRNLPAQYVAPVVALLVTCFGCIFALLILTSEAQDDQQRLREEQTLQIALQTSLDLIGRDLRDYAKWDDAVRNISRDVRPEWMADNVTAYLSGAQGYHHIFVLDGRDRTVYVNDGPGRVRDALAMLGPQFGRSVAAVRGMPTDGEPIATGFARQGDSVYIYSVGAVVPLTNKVTLPPGPTAMLVIADRFDRRYFDRMAEQYHLRDLKLVLTPPAEEDAAAPLLDRDGQAIAWLRWTPNHPGSEVRRQVLPALLLVGLIALVVAQLIVSRGNRTIRALQRSEARATRHANHDPLTGLPNRRKLITHINEMGKDGSQLSLLYMDLDGFKGANDVYGHAVGDMLLRNAARRIERAARGAFVARAGGDEFAMLLIDTPQAEVEAIAEAVVAALQPPFAVDTYSINLGVSVGLAHDTGEPDHDGIAGEGEGGLMRRADVAMYAAKADGKNRWRAYHPDMDKIHHLRMLMEANLRAAVENGEIAVLYQPIIDARSGEVTAVEALARWTHPAHGDVPPDTFVPLAEMTGLISPLGRHVLHTACTAARRWEVDVAVNLSPAQFWDRNLAGDIREVLDQTGFPADRLELEITESFLLRRPDAAAAVINELRSLGIRIALDDFGTGFASIGYLRKLSFDRLKIDRSFIDPLDKDPDAEELVAAIVGLAKSLGLSITAEGVETEVQAQKARAAGCARLQGWLYGKAESAEAMTARLFPAEHAVVGELERATDNQG
ncbi:putative bifunctional diguanylate cyclase/phosphodiesterase [Sphingomonas sanxanigenens]|uniref:putative bifunctional diguanylate cyclase/phosphodiesterase n=1 Tax=Sphingomonas sanxanigenens TaxID=397260 RepID=UPI00046C8CB9|nr:EAL domain-containing protein [Sphingomonas sanxanigenens]